MTHLESLSGQLHVSKSRSAAAAATTGGGTYVVTYINFCQATYSVP